MEHFQLPMFTILASLRRKVFAPHSDGHWRSACKRGPDREDDRRGKWIHRNGLTTICGFGSTDCSGDEGCSRWKITEGFGGLIGMG